jgi:hypothetical protein
MIGDAAKSQKFASRMLEKGVYGVFAPKSPARIRVKT